MDHGLSHDAVHHATQISREYQWSQLPQAYWRQPTVFGPLPGPRQDFKGLPYSIQIPPSTLVSTIKFRTSATLLRNLFPDPSYSFSKTDTVATASFSVQTLKNMPWLAGGSYDLIAFAIHGVQYTERSGKVTRGSFCPVLFENLADPILSGREELGFPKLFSDISIVDENGRREVSVSWRGAGWAKLSWNGIEKQAGQVNGDIYQHDHPAEETEGLFVHKYIPASDVNDRKQQRADADYNVYIPGYTDGSSGSTTVSKAADAEFEISNLGFQKLPTIHHIIERLAEVPCFEVVEATVTEADEVADLSNARRLL